MTSLTYLWVRFLLLFRKKQVIPPTQIDELETNVDAVLKTVDLLKFKLEDAFSEKLLTDQQIVTQVNQLVFSATRIRDLIKDNQNV